MRKKLSFKENRELENLPESIDLLEKEQEDLNLKMADPEYYRKKGFINETKIRIEAIQKKLVAHYRLWEELEKKL